MLSSLPIARSTGARAFFLASVVVHPGDHPLDSTCSPERTVGHLLRALRSHGPSRIDLHGCHPARRRIRFRPLNCDPTALVRQTSTRGCTGHGNRSVRGVSAHLRKSSAVDGRVCSVLPERGIRSRTAHWAVSDTPARLARPTFLPESVPGGVPRERSRCIGVLAVVRAVIDALHLAGPVMGMQSGHFRLDAPRHPSARIAVISQRGIGGSRAPADGRLAGFFRQWNLLLLDARSSPRQRCVRTSFARADSAPCGAGRHRRLAGAHSSQSGAAPPVRDSVAALDGDATSGRAVARLAHYRLCAAVCAARRRVVLVFHQPLAWRGPGRPDGRPGRFLAANREHFFFASVGPFARAHDRSRQDLVVGSPRSDHPRGGRRVEMA